MTDNINKLLNLLKNLLANITIFHGNFHLIKKEFKTNYTF